MRETHVLLTFLLCAIGLQLRFYIAWWPAGIHDHVWEVDLVYLPNSFRYHQRSRVVLFFACADCATLAARIPCIRRNRKPSSLVLAEMVEKFNQDRELSLFPRS